MFAFFLFKSTEKAYSKNQRENYSPEISRKSILSVIFPWVLVVLPYFFTFFMDSSAGTPGYFFLYYVMYLAINAPLALMSAAMTKQHSNTINIIMLFPAAIIFLLGFVFMG